MSVNGLTPSADNFPTPIDTASTASAQDTPTLSSGLLGNQPALAEVLAGNAEIANGTRGEGARLVQSALIELGADLGRWGADGHFGRVSERALSSFQRNHGLPASGRADAATLVKLDEALGGGSTGGTGTTGGLSDPAFAGNADLARVAEGGTPIARGARGAAVQLVQAKLIEGGYDLGHWGADGAFGRGTEGVLKQFQGDQGLPQSGKIDQATLLALDGGASAEPKELESALFKSNNTLRQVAEGNGTIQSGARGEAAKLVQQGLLDAGYDLGRWGADGAFGNGTKAVVTQFQRDNGISPANGVVDQKTLLALDAKLPTVPNDIVFLGMGDHAIHEVKDLQKRTGVVGITDSQLGDDKVSVTIDGSATTLDLQSHADVERFVGSLGVTGSRAVELEQIIENAGSDARDETALIMKAFHEAETGERVMERLVLSGHSVGTGVWGDSNGMFDMELLEQMCEAFPNAAGQIEDFMIAGCYSSSERDVARFRAMMPNVKSVWAYGDSAPGTWTGAMIHNALWEEASRGSNPGNVDRNVALNTRKGENVATWNSVDGYMSDGELRDLSVIDTEIGEQQRYFDSFFSGESTIADTQYGPMRDYYRLVQEALGHPEFPDADRPEFELIRDQTIRTIFYDATVKGRFHEAHGENVAAGFQALGLDTPDFSQLSRQEGLATILAFEEAFEANGNPPAAAREVLDLLTVGLRRLTPDHIPNTWV